REMEERNAGRREEMMKRFDKNGDGQLDEAEREAMRKEFGGRRRGEGRPAGDDEEDGPAPEERRGRRAEMMKRFDKNGDGKLDEAEREAMRKELGERRRGGRPAGDKENEEKKEII
ncbi:MAG: EF-hand domain-containing protein, partial [Planctomycetes bacterium]|nr:EF-hand domain-containing protein [Planctomycetota bacterium]